MALTVYYKAVNGKTIDDLPWAMNVTGVERMLLAQGEAPDVITCKVLLFDIVNLAAGAASDIVGPLVEQAQAAADASEQSANASELASNAALLDAVLAETARLASEFAAANALASAALVGAFSTKALADAAIGDFTEGQSIQVWNDPDYTLNGIYVKMSGGWTQISTSTVAAINAALTAPLNPPNESPPGTNIVIIDDLVGRIVLGVDGAGHLAFAATVETIKRIFADVPVGTTLTLQDLTLSAVGADEHPLQSIVNDINRRMIIAYDKAGHIQAVPNAAMMQTIAFGIQPLDTGPPGLVSLRTPTRNDGASRGYSIGSWWQRNGYVWDASRVVDGSAVWTQHAKPSLPGDVLPSALLAVYGVRRLVAAYAGAALRLRRRSDSTTRDIGFVYNGALDTTLIDYFAGGSVCDVVIVYDQSGNGYHLTEAGTFDGVAFTPPQITPFAFAGADRGIYFGNASNTGSTDPVLDSLKMPAGVAGSMRNSAAVSINHFMHITQPGTVCQLQAVSSRINSLVYEFSDFVSRLGLTVFSGNAARGFSNTHKPACARAIVSGFSCTTTSTTIWGEDNATIVASQPLNDTFAGGLVGSNSLDVDGGGVPKGGFGVQKGLILFNRAITAAEYRAVAEACYSTYRINRQERGVIVTNGDSIANGSVAAWYQGWDRQMMPQLTCEAILYHNGQGGSRFDSQLSVVGNWQATYDATAPFNVAVLAWGTNDIAADHSLATIQADLIAMVAAVKAAHPWDVVLSTVMPRGGFAIGGRQAVCDAYNPWLRANWRALGASFLIDWAADPVMGAPGWFNDPALCFDSTHPTALGHTYMAGTAQRATNAWLATRIQG